jgi:hypothetical protein
MSSIEPSSGRRLTRRQREQRAFRLTQATGGLTVATVVTGLLAVFGVLGWSLPFVLAIAAMACAILLRRTLRP